ncbi:MAG TPA: polyprenyl diphosphate synthase [Terriglobia bacterium]|nr:polyprenyl diphosphate synthase [Terriglobia bacterium]
MKSDFRVGAKKGRRLHIAIIMDGNGRWASARGLPRAAGHRAGAEAIRRIVDAAPQLGIGTLTVYAFSKNNWDRPVAEVAALMRLFEDFFHTEKEWWRGRAVRVSVIGRRNRLPSSLLAEIEAAEFLTHDGQGLHLRVAVDYSGQEAILEAAQRLGSPSQATHEEFSRLLAQVVHATAEDQEVDLLIRTGNEQRLSDFLLWEVAYAELFFSPCYWPDFGPEDLRQAIQEFRRRERRFGRLGPDDARGPAVSEEIPVLAGASKG